MAAPRRLIFGEVADVYDRHRPGYPRALIDAIVDRAAIRAGDAALEVGAGTGKATELMAQRGMGILAVEPSPEMAAVARRRLAGRGDVEIIESDFESVALGERTFPLLYSAQAWHWIDPATRYVRARAALRDGGLLAVFWNRVAWAPEDPVRGRLVDIYERIAPQMSRDGPLHPANPVPEGADDWRSEIAAAAGFGDPREERYAWSVDYRPEDYAALLSTLSEVRLLDPSTRERLLDAVVAALRDRGGKLTMPMVTRLFLARAT